jgi:lipid-binding SYLF domain-containing protein
MGGMTEGSLTMASKVGSSAAGLVLCLSFLGGEQVRAQSQEAITVENATTVLNEIMAIPVKQIPLSMLADAHGIAIVPNVLKGGFVVGVRHGRGVMTIRDESRAWRPPVFITLTGGSVGWQIGVQATDVILVFRTQSSVQTLLKGKFTIGADAAAAAGPVGRNAAAATDATLNAEIFSYSRSRGLFAGVALDGSVLQVDTAANQAYYAGTGYTPTGTVFSTTAQLPPSAVKLLDRIVAYTGGAVPATVATPPMPTGPNPPAGAAVTGDELAALRQQLASSSQQLQMLLDENWRRYLALPREIYGGNSPPAPAAVADALKRFEAVANDARYAALSERTEFQTTWGLLQSYASRSAGGASANLALPPPPGQTGSGRGWTPRY